ncbi:Phosphorylated adapter RNA export [Paramuricea clavata]|uniref:Phosphorylated adapter RNA export protein n=1 Tax=Paramuricea clavata TaxID=317549 RepID=A0A7D9EF16_PARCT|nr:Phosphorylated adapter RNA export [Paramuricea clavata]
MDDALELSIQDNEFDAELPQNDETQEICAKPDTKVKLETAFDPSDYISLTEAKQKLLQSLEQYDLKDDVKLCSRGSVKSRLGVREEGVEVMEYSDSNDLEGSHTDSRENEVTGPNQDGSDGSQSTNASTRSSNRADDIPRRPSMKNLCKRLHVRWYDNPVKVGKEIAERLEEHKFSLIIETVKIIGGKKALDLFNETKQVQLNGGMKTCNGSRRRTSGGVFLTLLKSSNYATDEQIKEIFKDDLSIKKEALKRKKAAYNQRKKARKLLEQQQANKDIANIEQQNCDTVQPENNSMQAEDNTNEVLEEDASSVKQEE